MHESHTPATTKRGLPACFRAKSRYFSTRLKSCVYLPSAAGTQSTIDCALPILALRARADHSTFAPACRSTPGSCPPAGSAPRTRGVRRRSMPPLPATGSCPSTTHTRPDRAASSRSHSARPAPSNLPAVGGNRQRAAVLAGCRILGYFHEQPHRQEGAFERRRQAVRPAVLGGSRGISFLLSGTSSGGEPSRASSRRRASGPHCMAPPSLVPPQRDARKASNLPYHTFTAVSASVAHAGGPAGRRPGHARS